MIEVSISEITIALLGGGLVSLIFFGGLKLTIERLATSHRPYLLLIGSVLMRFTIVMAVTYWVIAQIHWQALLVAVVGFIYVRLMLTRLISKSAEQ